MDVLRPRALAAAVLAALALAAPAAASSTGGAAAPVAGGTPALPHAGGTAPAATSAAPRPSRPKAPRPHRAPRPPRPPRPHRAPRPPRPPQPTPAGHRVPLAGPFTFGDPFGVSRPGHLHQGQDLLAPLGTPVVAPHGGTVTQVAYQAGGAGYYVVLSGAGEDLDYVFMHMVAGSVRVRTGQSVRIGQRIGDLGSTGDSSGPHLHFEVWRGPWQAGGRAVDPRPYLDAWR